jgi:hypothetical protein
MKLAVLLSLLLVPQMANAICEIPLVTDSTKVAKTGDTMTGSLIMSGVPISLTGSSGYINSESSITTLGRFFGPLTGNVTGNCSGTAGSLAATPTTAPSGYVSRGVDASGNAQTAWVETAATSGSTNPITSGAAFTALASKAASGSNGDITALTALSNGGLKDGTVYGQDIALSTVNLTNLNQSGASDGQVATWDNALGRWKPATPASGAGTVTTQGSPAAGSIAIFQSGTVISSSAFSTSAGGIVGASSVTYITVNETSLSSTTYTASCVNNGVTGSSVTVTLVSGQQVEVFMQGDDSNNTSTEVNTYYFKQDGVIPSPFSTPSVTAKSFGHCFSNNASNFYGCIARTIMNPGAGTHTYCLGAFTQSGTLTLSNLQFGVRIF